MLPILRQILTNKIKRYYTCGQENVAWVEGYTNESAGGQSKQATSLYIYSDGTDFLEKTYVSDLPIDLTHIHTLFVEWENKGNASNNVASYLIASTNKTGNVTSYNALISKAQKFGIQTSSLDVSALTGKYYIRVATRGVSAVTQLSVYRIWGVA